MFRNLARLANPTRNAYILNKMAIKPRILPSAMSVREAHDVNPGLAMLKHGRKESEDEFDARYVAYYSRPDIDGWEIRKAMNDMQGMDLVPEPKIIIAALKACRRVNDHALCIRYLEAIKQKCGNNKDIYPYILQEIRGTLDELGVSTPEEIGYDKPELTLQNPYDIY